MARKKKEQVETKEVATVTSSSFDYQNKLASLTPEEREEYKALTVKINPHDLSTLQEYGSELSQVVADNGRHFLSTIKSEDGGEVTQLVTDLLKELNSIDIDDINSNSVVKRFIAKIPILKNFVTTLENAKVKYKDIATNVDAISKKMGEAKIVALADNSTLQEIFDNNVEYIQRTRELILGLKVLLEDTESKYQYMQEHPNEFETWELNETSNFINETQKRITNMEITEQVLNQNLIQISATQGNNIAIAAKADEITGTVIPLWQNQLSISVIMNNQAESVKAQQLLAATTNEIIARNAKNLHDNSVAVAQANEATIIDFETLKTAQQQLINTIKDVQKIHEDGAKNREKIESELYKMGIELEDAINGK